MSDSNMHSLMVKEIQEIAAICKESPVKLEIGIVNLDSLYKAMKGFELASKSYVSLFNTNVAKEIRNDYNKKPTKEREAENSQSILNLARIYGRELKNAEMKELAVIICKKTGLFLTRDQKRNKQLLLNWFFHNWEIVEPAILKDGLDKMEFGKTWDNN